MTCLIFFPWVMHYDLHLLKAFILSLDAEPSGTTEVIFAPVDDTLLPDIKVD